MKKIQILLFIIIVSSILFACKKCYTCKPICYDCVYSITHQLICRDGFDSYDDFTTNLTTYQNAGYLCTEVDSSSTKEEICGSSSSVAAANADMKAQNGYRCIINR